MNSFMITRDDDDILQATLRAAIAQVAASAITTLASALATLASSVTPAKLKRNICSTTHYSLLLVAIIIHSLLVVLVAISSGMFVLRYDINCLYIAISLL